ncbi:xanthine and CO dehydrogenases maturation factor, XdhC/CoxF family [Leptolyngbyaceae cyanobacterium JSC-12]|nr:xanthine and CO dehydrogenases maturation factor, XdhC/CoxF family [Leptolyngbyaceae cyanobacterium JSC-12]
MSFDFYRQLAQTLRIGAVVLATVTDVKGSVPREVGAKMFIQSNGQVIGTIGGGAGEAKVIRQAMEVLQTGEKQRVEIDLSGASHRNTEGICGGMMQVWLERWQGKAAIALVQQILTLLESGQPATLVTPLEQLRSPFLLLSPSPSPLSPSSALSFPSFTETLYPPPTLLIVGAGHCGIQLAKVADLIGFQVIVQDDRPEWANAKHYPQAVHIFTDAIDRAISYLATHSQLYAALVTRGYEYDLEALKALLQRDIPCQYIGMIGSQKRVRQVFQALESAGIPVSKLQSIHAPIGLDIGALTPEEIAVSIAAELILVRRGGSGKPLSQGLLRLSNW